MKIIKWFTTRGQTVLQKDLATHSDGAMDMLWHVTFTHTGAFQACRFMVKIKTGTAPLQTNHYIMTMEIKHTKCVDSVVREMRMLYTSCMAVTVTCWILLVWHSSMLSVH